MAKRRDDRDKKGDDEKERAMLYRLGEDKGDGLINLDHVVAMRYYEIEGLGEKGFGIWMTGRDPKGQVPSYYVTKEQYDEIICILR